MLRQATYDDYYRDKAEPWQDSPQTLRYHLGRTLQRGPAQELTDGDADHCIDNLRQKVNPLESKLRREEILISRS